MKRLIEDTIRHYPFAFSSPIKVLTHLFTVNGNGMRINKRGFIQDNHECQDAFTFPDPEPLLWVYPWSVNPRYQPFRQFAGCRDVGFNEAVEYFIECLKITPDTLDDIKPWKENISLLEDVLINTPTIADEYSGLESGYAKFLKKIDKAQITSNRRGGVDVVPKSIQKVWFFDVQWSDCPEFVEAEVSEIWSIMGLGNDNFMYTCTFDKKLFEKYPNIYYWLKYSGVTENEKVIIHWWW
jgi:hypothetical protein